MPVHHLQKKDSETGIKIMDYMLTACVFGESETRLKILLQQSL